MPHSGHSCSGRLCVLPALLIFSRGKNTRNINFLVTHFLTYSSIVLRLVIMPPISRTLVHLAKLKFGPHSIKNVPLNPRTAPPHMILMLLGPPAGGVTPRLSFVTCVSRSIMSPGLTHDAACGRASFLFKAEQHAGRGAASGSPFVLHGRQCCSKSRSLTPGPGSPRASTGIVLTRFTEGEGRDLV